MDIFTFAGLLGSLAFATSGFLAGARKELDIVGVFIVTMLTANGGGAVRDVLLGRTPLVLTDPTPFYLVCGVITIALLFKLHKHARLERHWLFVMSDAIGLVAFSLTGTLAGLEAGLSIFGVMVLAFITATGGGILRDMMVNETPSLLSSDFYGTVALVMAASVYGLHHFGHASELNITIVFFLLLGLRMLAYLRGWHLPHIKL